MKVFIAILLCTVQVIAQEGLPPQPTPTKDPECNVGKVIFNGTHVVSEQRSAVCAREETTCQTKLEVSPTGYRIYRECKTPDACENNKNGNPQQCYSKEAEEKNEKVCHFCCLGDFCNNGDEIDVVLPTV